MPSLFPRFGLRLVACCFALTSTAICELASATITVQTTDGRQLTGEVDKQTDSQLLWIRQEKDQIRLTSSVAWSAVASVTDGEQFLSLEEAPDLLRAQATKDPVGFLVQQTIYHAPSDCPGGCPPVLSAGLPARIRPPKVRSLDIAACLVNLDRDIEPDGLELTIAAIGEHRAPVPVKGNLSVQLWGERIQPHGSLVRYERIQQWTQPVVLVDFVDGIARYALNFSTVHPEIDLGLHSEAQLDVRLGVYGQGNFAASVPVQIRRFNPVRDRLQLKSGGRFFPGELTQQGRRQLPHRTHTRQLTIR